MKTAAIALVIAALSAALVWQLVRAKRLLDENAILRAQVETASALTAEKERLSNLVAQAAASQPISEEQFQELLRLRGEVGVLRKQKAEVEKLHAENRQLLAATGQPLQSPGQTMSDFVPKESFTNVGYATPEAAFQTFSWAWQQGDTKSILASVSAEGRARMEADWSKKTEAELAAQFHNEHSSNYTGHRIVNRKEISSDEVLFSVYIGGEEESFHKFRMKRYGNEWKLAGGDKD
ncbi:MAG: hypothetical protein EXS35_14245 [Pedosphaera sp.]|nr:hypothetical protein [Pedosphaera sp.]